MSFHNTWCEISGRALATNVEILRRRLHPDAALGVVVKSGAYGHGIACCVPVFLRAGVDWLIVNDVAEAAHVRSLTEDTPIYICSPVPEALAGAAVAARARVVVTAPEGVLSLARAGRAEGWEVPVHLKAETGCHRLGVDMAGLLQLAELVTRTEGVRLEGVATHFADIEDTTNHTYAREQLQSLESAAQSLRDKGHTLPMVHAANSAATILWPEAHHQLVRVGEADVRSLVVCEIEIVSAEGLHDPVGNADERGAIDVVAHPVVHMRSDDRLVEESRHFHGRLSLV